MTRPLSNCCTWGCNTWPKSGPSPFQSGKPPSINSSCCLGSGCRCEKSYTLNLTTSVTWEKQVEQKTPYVGRGRGSVSREKRVIQTTRSHSTHIARQQDKMTELRQRFGWKAFVTKAGQKRLSWQHAVLCSRNAYRVERLFNRLK